MDASKVQQMLDPLFPGLMGVKLTVCEPDRIVAEMVVRPDLCTGGGILHGGAYMAFADTLVRHSDAQPRELTTLASRDRAVRPDGPAVRQPVRDAELPQGAQGKYQRNHGSLHDRDPEPYHHDFINGILNHPHIIHLWW